MRKNPFGAAARRLGLALSVAALPLLWPSLAARADEAAAVNPMADYLVGHVASAMGDYAVAGPKFAAVLARDPHNQAALNEGFEVMALSGGDVLPLAAQLPHNGLALLELANHALLQGQWDEAAKDYAALPNVGPFPAMKPVLLAWCDAGSGRTIAAVARLRRAAEGSPLAGQYMLHAAFIEDRAGRVSDASEFYRAAQAGSAQVSLRFALAQASFLARTGQLNTAKGMLTDLLSGVPQDSMSLPRLLAHVQEPLVASPSEGVAEFLLAVGLELGNSANDSNEDSNAPAGRAAANAQMGLELSRVFLQMAVTLRPDFTEARLVAASEDQRAGRNQQAWDTLAPVAAQDPMDGQVRLARGLVLDQLGQTDAALALLAQLCLDYPDHAEPYEVIGDINRQRGRPSDAVAAYDQAIKRRGALGADDWVLLFDRAVAEQDSGHWPDAENDLQYALRLSPNQPNLLNFLGYSWADQNRNLPEARRLLEQAVKLAPQDGAILDSLGWVQFRQGEVSQAVRTLETAVQMDPEDPDVNTHLGDAYQAVGRRLEARYQWQFALTLNPSQQLAARLKADLERVEAVSEAKQVRP